MIEGRWLPQNENEWQLLEDLHTVTRHAHSEGVSRARIASLMAFMASAAVDPEESPEPAQDRAQARDEQMSVERETQEITCPVCDAKIVDVDTGFGLQPVRARPCNHNLSARVGQDRAEEIYHKVIEYGQNQG